MEGRLLLDRFLTHTGISHREFAKRLGVSSASISLWRNRVGQVPSLANARALERETKGAVPASAWVDEPDRLIRRPSGRPSQERPQRSGNRGSKRRHTRSITDPAAPA